MNIVVLQVFVSLMLVVGSLVLLAYSVRQADYEHADRLSLLPVERDESPHASDDVVARELNNTGRASSPDATVS